MVSLNLDLYLDTCPIGAMTDCLQDTVCYAELIQNILHFCHSRSFNLIEALTQAIHHFIVVRYPPSQYAIGSMRLEIRKMAQLIPCLHGHISWMQHIYFNEKKERLL